MKLKLSILMIIISAVLGGCAGTAGNQKLSEHTQESIAQNIVEGKTTQDQVKSLLGEPTVLSYTEGGVMIFTHILFLGPVHKALTTFPSLIYSRAGST